MPAKQNFIRTTNYTPLILNIRKLLSISKNIILVDETIEKDP